MNLGDSIHRALAEIGVTSERVERWVGAPCGCKERQEKLNRLGWWAARTLRQGKEGAEQWLSKMLGSE